MKHAKYPIELEPNENGERWRLAKNEIISHVHLRKDCKGVYCALHNPSDHSMRSFRLHYRHDWGGFFERICEHGVGHDDPDNYNSKHNMHGCDGCCFDVSQLTDEGR